jgi:hypothetical protein
MVHSFSYSDSWQPASDGQGPSLQIRNEAGGDLLAWGQPDAWTISRRQHGSPGTNDDSKPGDANHDGRFDSRDLVLIFAAGEYDDGIAGNSSWEDGDWNDDGEFDSADLVLAFIAGGYVPASRPRDLAGPPVVDAIWAASVSPDSMDSWELRRPRTNARSESNEVTACGFV